jgi:uncharacterized protein (DUF885 family)
MEARTRADGEFDKLVEGIFEKYLEIDPVVATYLGIHKYDHLLPDVSRSTILKNIEVFEGYLEKLKTIDLFQLTGERIHDYRVVGMGLELELFRLKELRFWEKNPGSYAELLGGSIYPLYAREFAPLSVRAESIASRLEKVEEALEQSKTSLVAPVKLWTEIAMETCVRTPFFIDMVVEYASNVGGRLADRLRSAADDAKKSIGEYRNWLEQILPEVSEEYAISRELYDKLIELRRLGFTTSEILSLGEKYLEEYRRELEGLASRIKPGAGVGEVRDFIKGKHPETFEEAFDLYSRAMGDARKFVVQRGVASIPPGERLKVEETPIFIRHLIPFAAYLPPAPFEKDQTGHYFVTPIEDKPEMLREHSYASIINTSVHEAYPGHHLHLIYTNRHPSLVRRAYMAFGAGAEVVEGWAHWTEDFMREVGFEDSLEMRFLRTLDMLWRAVRIIVDIKLCTGEMSFEEAVDMLVREVGMEKPAALAEVKRYTSSPTYQLSYLLGKHLVEELRREVKEKLGEKYSDRFFVETLLTSGAVPYSVLRDIFEEKVKALTN